MALTEPETQAYIALSDMFLDTEMSDWMIESIVSRLARTSLTIPTLEAMLRDTLFPILFYNILAVAGIWSGFDEEWLISEASSMVSSPPGWVARLYYSAAWYTFRFGIQPTWDKVKDRLRNLD